MLVSVLQAELTRNQLSVMLGGNSHIMWLSMNSLYLPCWLELELESTKEAVGVFSTWEPIYQGNLTSEVGDQVSWPSRPLSSASKSLFNFTTLLISDFHVEIILFFCITYPLRPNSQTVEK